MDTTTILVIGLAFLFFAGMGTLVIIANTPPKKAPGEDPAEDTKQQTRLPPR